MRELEVAPAQQGVDAANEEPVAKADDGDHCVPLAIYAEDRPVGFVLYARDPDDGDCWIHQLKIDKRYQRRGNGRMALVEMLKLMSTLPGCDHVCLGVAAGNEMAMVLYRQMGFDMTGEIIGGEVVFRRDLSVTG
jgi:diamine N-acetyltransferase